jgi:zinc transport system substrate-binding protein
MRNNLIICTLLIILSACHSTQTTRNSKSINVSILPQKYIIDKISGGTLEVNVMVTLGNNHETYEPSPQQMMKMERSPLYLQLCKNGFDEPWVASLKTRNSALKVVDLSNGITLLTGHNHCDNHDHQDHHEAIDPHVWISPSTMKVLAKNTMTAMIAQFPEDSTSFKNGYQKLEKEISTADSLYINALSKFKGRSMMVYHPVLGYVARDYGLTELAIETEGKEPSVESLKNLIELAKQNHVKAIFIQQEYDTRNAQIIANEIDAKIVQFDPMAYNWPQAAADLLQKLTQNLDAQ